LRVSLENFVRQLLGNRKSLENNKDALLKWMDDHNTNTETRNMMRELFQFYCNYQNNHVKHGDGWKPAEVTLTCVWYRSGKTIKGATAGTCKPVAADVGKTIKVKVSGTAAGYPSATATSKSTKKVARRRWLATTQRPTTQRRRPRSRRHRLWRSPAPGRRFARRAPLQVRLLLGCCIGGSRLLRPPAMGSAHGRSRPEEVEFAYAQVRNRGDR